MNATEITVRILNELFRANPTSMWEWSKNSYQIPKDFALEHPTVQCGVALVVGSESYTTGNIGILNGILLALGERPVCQNWITDPDDPTTDPEKPKRWLLSGFAALTDEQMSKAGFEIPKE